MSTHALAAYGTDSIDVQGRYLQVVGASGKFEVNVEGEFDGRPINDKVTMYGKDLYEFGGIMRRVTLRDLSGSSNTIEIMTGWGKYFPGLEGSEVIVTNTVAVTGPLTDAQLRATPVPVDVNITAATPHRHTATASTNATSVKATAGKVHSITGTNTSAGTLYLKLYDLAAAPVVGTDVPVMVYALPAGVPFNFDLGDRGASFGTGIAFAITGGIVDADTTPTVANDVVQTITYT